MKPSKKQVYEPWLRASFDFPWYVGYDVKHLVLFELGLGHYKSAAVFYIQLVSESVIAQIEFDLGH